MDKLHLTKNITPNILTASKQLYIIYMKKWNSEHSTSFDDSIRKCRRIIFEKYLTNNDCNPCLTNIPSSFDEFSSGYWSEIICKSNRYVPNLEDHNRCRSEEIYIRELLPCIRYFLLNKSKHNQNDLKLITDLSLLLLAYNIRDIFIEWINMLDKYLKIIEIEEYDSLNQMLGDAFYNLMVDQIKPVQEYIIEHVDPDYKANPVYSSLYRIYKCLNYIIKLWYDVRNSPSVNNISDLTNLVLYHTNLYNNNYYRVATNLIFKLNKHDQVNNNIIELLDNSMNLQNMSQIQNLNISLDKIQQSLQEQIDDVDQYNTPRMNQASLVNLYKSSAVPRLTSGDISLNDGSDDELLSPRNKTDSNKPPTLIRQASSNQIKMRRKNNK